MLTAIVTLLGGWRATAFAAACVVLLTFAGTQQARIWSRDRAIVDLQHAAEQHAAEDTAAALAAETAARKREQDQAATIAAIEARYAKETADATATASRVADGLRAGTLSLRRELAACGARRVPEAGSVAAEPDGSAELRAAVARTVAIGHACDARVTALQDVLRAER